MRLKAENPYFMMIKFAGRKVEISAYNISKKTRFVGYFSDTNMNLLFQRKCVNSAVESIYNWVSQHLINMSFRTCNTSNFAESCTV